MIVPRNIEFAFSQATYNVNEGDGVVVPTIELIRGSLSQIIAITINTFDLFAVGELVISQGTNHR